MEKILRAFEKSRGKTDPQSKRDAADEPRLPDPDEEESDHVVSLEGADEKSGTDAQVFSRRASTREEDFTPDTAQNRPREKSGPLEWEDDWNRPRAELPDFAEDVDETVEEPPLELDERDEVSDSQIRDPFDVSRRVEELLGAAKAEMDEVDDPARKAQASVDGHQEPHFDHVPDRAEPDHGEPNAPRVDSGLRITAISAHDPFSPVSEEEEEGFGWTVFFTVLAVVAVAGMLGLFYLAQSHPDAAELMESAGRLIGELATMFSEWWRDTLAQ